MFAGGQGDLVEFLGRYPRCRKWRLVIHPVRAQTCAIAFARVFSTFKVRFHC
jgi:hypothetical protein